jgi:hypothetical protein
MGLVHRTAGPNPKYGQESQMTQAPLELAFAVIDQGLLPYEREVAARVE